MRRNTMIIDTFSDLLRELGHFMLFSVGIPFFVESHSYFFLVTGVLMAIVLWFQSLYIVKR